MSHEHDPRVVSIDRFVIDDVEVADDSVFADYDRRVFDAEVASFAECKICGEKLSLQVEF